MFYSLYYLITGIHGLHILTGVVILAAMLFLVPGKTGKTEITTGAEAADRRKLQLENSALFWHLVTIAWIFLFPLVYLIT